MQNMRGFSGLRKSNFQTRLAQQIPNTVEGMVTNLKESIPNLSSFLDTFPKKGFLTTIAGSEKSKIGTESYLETMSPMEKRDVVKHYKELAPLFDLKVTHSSKKEALTTALNKALIEGCILSDVHVSEKNRDYLISKLDELVPIETLKVIHVQNSTLMSSTFDDPDLISIQIRGVPIPSHPTFLTIDIQNLKQNLATLFPNVFNGSELSHSQKYQDDRESSFEGVGRKQLVVSLFPTSQQRSSPVSVPKFSPSSEVDEIGDHEGLIVASEESQIEGLSQAEIDASIAQGEIDQTARRLREQHRALAADSHLEKMALQVQLGQEMLAYAKKKPENV
jgi:hypothetical protein